MSLSWRDHLLIGLAPDRVAVLHLRRGLRPMPGVDRARDCPAVADGSAPPWSGALQALGDLLPELPPAAGGARVVLSNRFVRYGRVPWTEGVFADADRRALARESMRGVHGDAVDAWHLTVDAPRYGCDALSAAIDALLLERLRAVLARRRLRLAALRPHLATALQHWQARFTPADTGFVLVEPGCVTSLYRRYGRWTEVANRRYRAPGDATGTVRQIVDAARVEGGAGGVVLLAPGVAIDAGGGAGLRRLPGSGNPWPDDPWRSMAWSAA